MAQEDNLGLQPRLRLERRSQCMQQQDQERSHPASDIPLLVDHLLRDIAGTAPPLIASGVMRIFMRYSWPGNVRELRNCLARMALLASDGVLGVEQLPAEFQEEEVAPDLPAASTIRGAERKMVLAAIRREGGNVSRAARSLGIARTTLYRHIRRRSAE
jgi:transcriptional regulator of acetoin/glycerol metabolism